jgi:hypothetical protein
MVWDKVPWGSGQPIRSMVGLVHGKPDRHRSILASAVLKT